MEKKIPKLRTVSKSVAPYPLNKFPKDFPYKIGKELIYLLATKGKAILEGQEWESIFATCIGAQWAPSNVGLDDVALGNTAWGAKSVKAGKPSEQKKVRLISGRNSVVYSYGSKIDTEADPNILGQDVLGIWNHRVDGVREKFQNLRTVVLIKSDDLNEVVVFEFDTDRYVTELFEWRWNKKGNLEGFNKETKEHRFTWQPHGSQFTIIENVPHSAIVIHIQQPETLNKESVLDALGFEDSWVKITHRGED